MDKDPSQAIWRFDEASKGAEVTVIKSGVFHVLGKFPDRAGDIKQLHKKSQAFRTVCGDYRQCSEALHHWNQSHEKESPNRKREYELLLQELADEILLYLNESKACEMPV